MKAKITTKGQLTVPAKIRVKLDLHPGDIVSFSQKNKHIIFVKEKNDIEASFGIVKSKQGVSLEDMQKAIESGATDD